MADGNLVRLGGIFGLVSVVAMIPAYLVGYPDAPGSQEEAGSYFETGLGTFVFSNGVLPLFHVFFFILFLGVLYGLLRGAEEYGDREGGIRGALPAAALGGGPYSPRSRRRALRRRSSSRQPSSALGPSNRMPCSCWCL
jgi:uncharacterized membrane protein